jgi:hypothetical protein
MSRDHYLLLCGVTAGTENTTSFLIACWTVFTELLPGNALIKSVTISRTMKWVKYAEYKRLIRNAYIIFIRNLEEATLQA